VSKEDGFKTTFTVDFAPEQVWDAATTRNVSRTDGSHGPNSDWATVIRVPFPAASSTTTAVWARKSEEMRGTARV
jgi:hypothetical protein